MGEKRTRTRNFGASSRIGHNSDRFYNRKIYHGDEKKPETLQPNQDIPQSVLDKVYCHSSEYMTELPDCSVHLVITSPPYNVGKEYDADLTIEEYRTLLRGVFQECYRVLVEGGRACINVANIGRKPYISLNTLVANVMIDLGYLMRGEIIWNKGASAGTSCAWGSWRSPSNPVLRDIHEYILVFSKESFSLLGENATIDRDDFLECTKSIWDFPAESARKVGHPAPFPVELPRRLIELYSYQGDVVLDPFIGSGSSAVASVKTGRRWIGYDTSNDYCNLTRRRVQEAEQRDLFVDEVF